MKTLIVLHFYYYKDRVAKSLCILRCYTAQTCEKVSSKDNYSKEIETRTEPECQSQVSLGSPNQ